MANTLKLTKVIDNVKGINFDLWGGIDNFLASTSSGAGGSSRAQQLRRFVPWLAKATDMTASAVANLPFYIMKGKTIFDSSYDWQNKIGGLKSPDSLFYQLAGSLSLGRAYIIPTITSKMLAGYQYVAPQTIQPQINAEGLQYFDRTTDKGKVMKCYPAESEQEPLMMYFWLPDPDVEIGPALSYPAGDALLAANMLYNMDTTITTYSERGFVPATLLSVKGMPAANERERAETWWNRFLRGWTKEAAKILNAEAMDVKQVGAGMEQLKGSYLELTKQQIENIGTAFGIPSGLFMADMSYATEVKHLIKLWYSTSAFVKMYKTIEKAFNEQLLYRWDLELRFAPDEIDAFQEEEVERATAFSTYVNAGIKHSVAAQMIGLELPEGVSYEDLDAYVEEKAKLAQEQFEQRQAQEKEEEKPVEPEDEPEEDEPENKALELVPVSLTASQIKELNLWRQIAERNFKKGKGCCADFEVKALDESMAGIIRLRLQSAKTLEDVSGAFVIEPAEKGYMKELDIQRMIDALEMNLTAIESEVKAMPDNYTFPVTVNVPAPVVQTMPAPVVNITQPDVNITNKAA